MDELDLNDLRNAVKHWVDNVPSDPATRELVVKLFRALQILQDNYEDFRYRAISAIEDL